MSVLAIVLILLAGALFFFLIVPAVGVFFAVFYRKKAIPFEQYNQKKYQNHYYIPYLGRVAQARDWLKAHEHTSVWVTNGEDMRLYGEFYDQGSSRTAVLFHGIAAEMYTNLSGQARLLYQMGFNVLLTCQRAHGKSEGRFTTIGLREQDDVLCWAQFAQEQGANEILLYGVSMGAAAVAYASDKLQNTCVKGVVIDSGFTSVYEQMRRDAYKNHIPKIMLPAERLMALLFLHIDIKKPVTDSLRHAQAPVLFLHGTADETVECRWSEVNYNACAAPKKRVVIEGAPHTLSVLHSPEETAREIRRFAERYFNAY